MNGVVQLPAPAKLTLSLRITGVREDGMHLIDAEMVTLSLHDVVTIDPEGDGVALAPVLAPGEPDRSRGATIGGRAGGALALVRERAPRCPASPPSP